ncbi:MAG: hypothetical protein ACR2MA_13345 [Egibacteraceae bacterium]
MAVATSFSLTDAALGRAMSFIVVDPDGVQYEVKTAGEAARYLADAWSRTLETIGGRELLPYSPEVVIRADEERALVMTDDLREENEIVGELLADDDRPQVKPSQVSGVLYLYAVVSDTKAGRIAMIKKKNPTKRARAGRVLFAAGDELRELEEDPWELDPLFDLVVGTRGGYALNTHFFEQLFADADRLRAKIGPWVADIAKQLPMSKASRDLLVTSCDASPRLRRRLRAITHRGHIGRVTVTDVHRHVREMGLPPANFVKNQQLVVDEDNLGELLRMLNEDLTRGGLTQDPFRIESKEPM